MSLIAILITTAVVVFIKPIFDKDGFISRSIAVPNQKEKTFSELSQEKIVQNSDGSHTYNGEYFSVTYPKNWYNWGFGKGVSLDLFFVHSIPGEDEKPIQKDQPFHSIFKH